VSGTTKSVAPGDWVRFLFHEIESTVTTGAQLFIQMPEFCRVNVYFGDPVVRTGWDRFDLLCPGRQPVGNTGRGVPPLS